MVRIQYCLNYTRRPPTGKKLLRLCMARRPAGDATASSSEMDTVERVGKGDMKVWESDGTSVDPPLRHVG